MKILYFGSVDIFVLALELTTFTSAMNASKYVAPHGPNSNCLRTHQSVRISYRTATLEQVKQPSVDAERQ
jgi:hypothetical protein